jgi:hypothetical protein
MEGVMGRPRKLPPNVVRFRPTEERALKRAEPLKGKPRYFYRDTPPNKDWLIFEFTYHNEWYGELWYANGQIIDGQPLFQHKAIQEEYLAGNIKLLSWRLESEWRSA